MNPRGTDKAKNKTRASVCNFWSRPEIFTEVLNTEEKSCVYNMWYCVINFVLPVVLWSQAVYCQLAGIAW